MEKRAQFEAMLAQSPDDVFILYALAMLDVSDGLNDSALARFERLIELDGDYVPAWFQSGQLLARIGRSTEARNTLQQGIAVAERIGDRHAVLEMNDFLDGLL